jgi:hypothetical protein
MANIRLFGLVLIITTMMLGLAALTTQTTQIRFRRDLLSAATRQDRPQPDPWRSSDNTGQYGNDGQQRGGAPNPWQLSRPSDSEAYGVEFVSVPVLFPLIAAGLLGMVLWFAPTVVTPKPTARRTSGKGRRRNRLFPRL